MSILIKGMEMPKPKFTDMAAVYCAYVLVRPNGHVSIVVDNEDGLDSTEYPLAHVPPHGRLIDADALGSFPYNMDFCDGGEADEWIQNAPTIIEAEG